MQVGSMRAISTFIDNGLLHKYTSSLISGFLCMKAIAKKFDAEIKLDITNLTNKNKRTNAHT